LSFCADGVASNKRAKFGDEDAETKEASSPSNEEAKLSETQDPKEGGTTSKASSADGDAAVKPKAKGKKEKNMQKEKTDDEVSGDDADHTAKLMREDLQYESGFAPFPEKLMNLLNSGEVKDKMWWLPEGDAFCFIPENFAETVLAKHFQGTKLESFTRKLNRWCVELIELRCALQCGIARLIAFVRLIAVSFLNIFSGGSGELRDKK